LIWVVTVEPNIPELHDRVGGPINNPLPLMPEEGIPRPEES
jgi:hypothetical protein